MGFFTKDASVPTGGLAPLSNDRVKAALERENYAYSVDSDGDIGAGWDMGGFYFFVKGEQNELFCIRGNWRAKLPAELFDEAVAFCNEVNMEKLWPKVYARKDDEGLVRLYTEHNVDYEYGCTDEQISLHMHCTLSSSFGFFERLNEKYPEIWEQYKPEDD